MILEQFRRFNKILGSLDVDAPAVQEEVPAEIMALAEARTAMIMMTEKIPNRILLCLTSTLFIFLMTMFYPYFEGFTLKDSLIYTHFPYIQVHIAGFTLFSL